MAGLTNELQNPACLPLPPHWVEVLATTPGFYWVMRMETQVFRFAQQGLDHPNHLHSLRPLVSYPFALPNQGSRQVQSSLGKAVSLPKLVLIMKFTARGLGEAEEQFPAPWALGEAGV